MEENLTHTRALLPVLSFSISHLPPTSTLFPYTTLFRSLCKLFTESVATSFPLLMMMTRSQVIIINKGKRSEEHTSELQSHHDLVCRLLLEKKKFGTVRDVYNLGSISSRCDYHWTARSAN